MATPIFVVDDVTFARQDAAFGQLCTAAKRIVNVYQSYQRCRMPKEAKAELDNLRIMIDQIEKLGPIVGAGPKK